MERYILAVISALIACTAGRICGFGGGVIIKPVLDMLGTASVSEISFISGCTVLAMSLWSVGKSSIKKDSMLDYKTAVPLGLGAAAGGILGKLAFSYIKGVFNTEKTAGAVQTAVLFLLVVLTFVYTLNKDKLKSYRLRGIPVCAVAGIVLGFIGAFLGIGGGPFNMAALFILFSMNVKEAAENSICIILISQIFSLLFSLLSGTVPPTDLKFLAAMIAAGIIGSEAGNRINKRLSERSVNSLFLAMMILVMGICIYNMIGFLS